jgi:hypothetical protein
MIELIVGTVPKEPPIRLLAMPASSMILAFGIQMLIIDILRYFKVPAPLRISSLPRGSALRPGIYSIIEDVCAVDGSGGTEFRQRLNLRFKASHHFRAMLHRLTLFWAFGSLAAGIGTTVGIFTLDSKDAAYVVRFLSIPMIHVSKLTYPFTTARLGPAIRLGSHMDTNYNNLRKEITRQRTKTVDRGESQGCCWTLDEQFGYPHTISGATRIHHLSMYRRIDPFIITYISA